MPTTNKLKGINKMQTDKTNLGEANILPRITLPVEKDGWRSVTASSFADPADVAAFRRAKAQGMSDKRAFAVGDNGIGCWGDATSRDSGPSCALPPEDIIERWGSLERGKHAVVEVAGGPHGATVRCLLKDRMPHRADIGNGCSLDLNPDALASLGWQPGEKYRVRWRWAALLALLAAFGLSGCAGWDNRVAVAYSDGKQTIAVSYQVAKLEGLKK